MTRVGLSLFLLLAAGGATADAAAPAASTPPTTANAPAAYARRDPVVPVELIVAPGRFSAWFLQQVRAEAAAVWKRNGVTLAWRSGAEVACETPLRVWIEGAPGTRADVMPMGSILFTQGVPLPAIYLSVENVESLMRAAQLESGGGPVRDLLVARALGRTLAHEVGHYVLSRQTHVRRGLMRATWPIQEAVAGDRQKFELTPDQRAAAIEHLAAEPMDCGS